MGMAKFGLRNLFRSPLRLAVVALLIAFPFFLLLVMQTIGVLEPKGTASGPVTFKVVKGTQITDGSKHLFLPGTNRRFVAITYVEDKGEKVAKSIEVKEDKR